MKINTRYLGLRILTFPVKLVFTVLWFFLYSLKCSVQWILFGSQELYYGKDKGANLVEILEQNKEIIKLLRKVK